MTEQEKDLNAALTYARVLEEANTELRRLLRLWQRLFWVMTGLACMGLGLVLWAALRWPA